MLQVVALLERMVEAQDNGHALNNGKHCGVFLVERNNIDRVIDLRHVEQKSG